MNTYKTANLTPTSEEQLGIVCYVPEQKVVESRQWNSLEKTSRRGSPAGLDDLVSVGMSISQAPPSFRQPVTQKKACFPPFKIQISVCFGNGCSQLPVKVNVYSLTADSLASFLKQAQHNSFATLPSDGGLANASIYKCLENRHPNSTQGCPVVQETFEFVDMYFKTSSRMAQRWLLFVARVREDILCTVYKHPTIVLSRKTDQYCKACSLLTKRNPILEITDRSSLTTSQTRPQSSSSCNKDPAAQQHVSLPTDVKEWILAAYGEHHFRRSLTSYDLGYLGIKLGIRGLTMQSMAEPWTLTGTEEDRRRFDNFAHWYLACLASLKRENTLWCSDDVMRICPFMVDRTIGEDLLEQEAVGTFIVRISSEPGSFVLSVKEISFQGEYIEHFLIDALDLKRQPLSSWVMVNHSARLFLDVRSGAKFPKHFIFTESMSYSQPHFINNVDPRSFPGNALLFNSNTDSDGTSSPVNLHKYAHLVFGTS